MKKLIDQFNHLDVSLVISDYPDSTVGGGKNYGIAWYTKETLEPLAKRYNRRFVVLGEKQTNKKSETYANGKIAVFRVFDPTHHSLFPTILQWLLKFPYIHDVYVHSEFCTNGGLKNFALLLPFLFLIKLLGKNIIYFSHNVVTSFDGIGTHLNLGTNPVKLALLNSLLKIYYRVLGLICNRVVVMDTILKKRLSQFVSEDKIVLSPFWTEKKDLKINKALTRKKLNISKDDFVLLYFGFITWYKGADWIIQEIKSITSKMKNGRKIKLIIAGGPSYSLKDQDHYKKYYQNILNSVRGDPRIIVTGFVPENEIDQYFAVSNLCVFPYRGYIGSSGAITHAISRQVPFVISKHMSETLVNEEYQKAFRESGLKEKDLVFSFKSRSLILAINRFKNKKFCAKAQIFLSSILETKSIKNILPILAETVYTRSKSQMVSYAHLKPIFNLLSA
ncbi:hypothetical protein A3D77_06485 [Candidatus Gottesmanbacteria bacterium RIFCSPHIGHO2_02_FULL_39_11]|uniref:Glycosyl transferase family 1 domain-containing protein n=1 Tax=Candidatus Gottesmanbacteria bacterium RIFCSPHIGHO2_02_FULL_39_11 TaxID=1798382 RepID=A0A1F5ZSP1_9BACT|nr:MAG: hypothetical protein A3D77_06485 [Candidatus Gottesmanbacteria bacterium RIFCSPHIGHO2_02_FULL_39_11]